MLLLLHALIPSCCTKIYCPHPLSCCICTALVSLVLGTAIPNILMEMFYSLVSLIFRCIETVICYIMPIKAYNSTVQEFCAVQLMAWLYGRVGAIPT